VQYVEALRLLFQELVIPISEAEKVRLTFRNLAEHLQLMLCNREYGSVRELVADATRVEFRAKRLLGSREPSVRDREEERPSGKSDRAGRETREGNRGTPSCYICGNPNHFARSCPQRMRATGEGQGNARGASLSDTNAAPGV